MNLDYPQEPSGGSRLNKIHASGVSSSTSSGSDRGNPVGGSIFTDNLLIGRFYIKLSDLGTAEDDRIPSEKENFSAEPGVFHAPGDDPGLGRGGGLTFSKDNGSSFVPFGANEVSENVGGGGRG